MLTIEEKIFIADFDIAEKDELLESIQRYLYMIAWDPEVKEFCEKVIHKLEKMSEKEFKAIDFESYREDAAYDNKNGVN